jgi:methionyl-tRNA synthetase
MFWGVPVPGDEKQVMYVWFDALVNYISTLGWPENEKKFEKFWPGVQVCGKDNLRQQSAMWQAMLMSANLPNSKQIFINGFITVDSQKMSKSIGNVISPYEMVSKFGTDATRYLLLSGASFGEDFDMTWEKLTEKYNADLANGLGNLLSRVVKLSTEFEYKINEIQINNEFKKLIDSMELGQALDYVWKIISDDNKFIGENKPWELVKTDMKKFGDVMEKLFIDLNLIAEHLVPFMPETSEKIKKALETKKLDEVLFQRIK